MDWATDRHKVLCKDIDNCIKLWLWETFKGSIVLRATWKRHTCGHPLSQSGHWMEWWLPRTLGVLWSLEWQSWCGHGGWLSSRGLSKWMGKSSLKAYKAVDVCRRLASRLSDDSCPLGCIWWNFRRSQATASYSLFVGVLASCPELGPRGMPASTTAFLLRVWSNFCLPAWIEKILMRFNKK